MATTSTTEQEQQSVNITQRATNPNPTTAPKQKDPKAVARGKASAQKRNEARAAQVAALADLKEENNKLKQQAQPPPQPPPSSSGEAQKAEQEAPAGNDISPAMWLAIAGLGVTLFTTYVKREDFKAVKDYFAGGGGKKNNPEGGTTISKSES